jgi:hypothetical protein
MLVQVMMQAMGDGGVRDITSLLATSPTRNDLGFVQIQHAKVFHFFHRI